MTTVREMMTDNPESVEAEATVQEAAGIMQKLNVGSVPVVSGGRVAGIVTDRDITIRLIAENRRPSQTPVRQIATPDPLTVTPDTALSEASKLMAEHQIRRLPVVSDGSLVGMLSLGDVSVDGDAREAGRALADISVPAQPVL
ncbi:MAG: CBS domain-containing protein [Dehalococcoidia bacterium]